MPLLPMLLVLLLPLLLLLLHHERGRRATMPIRDGRRRCSHLLVATAAALNWH